MAKKKTGRPPYVGIDINLMENPKIIAALQKGGQGSLLLYLLGLLKAKAVRLDGALLESHVRQIRVTKHARFL